MLALPVLAISSAPLAADPALSSALLVAIVVGAATLVLLSIALDLRQLRRSSRLRATHGVLGAGFSVIVIAGALAMSMTLGSAPAATAGQQKAPAISQVESAPEPAPIDTTDITDPSTDIQLPTLGRD
jgi:NADH:ubiquinone oxidoreductase subunit 6 (subunit J)